MTRRAARISPMPTTSMSFSKEEKAVKKDVKITPSTLAPHLLRALYRATQAQPNKFVPCKTVKADVLVSAGVDPKIKDWNLKCTHTFQRLAKSKLVKSGKEHGTWGLTAAGLKEAVALDTPQAPAPKDAPKISKEDEQIALEAPEGEATEPEEEAGECTDEDTLTAPAEDVPEPFEVPYVLPVNIVIQSGGLRKRVSTEEYIKAKTKQLRSITEDEVRGALKELLNGTDKSNSIGVFLEGDLPQE